MKDSAVIITNGKLATLDGKTAHGLIRGSERFDVLAVIDHAHAGKDVREIVPRASKQIPIYASMNTYLQRSHHKPDYCILGVALPGGKLPREFIGEIQAALENGISVISGLHQHLSDNPVLRETAVQHQAEIIDIRKPCSADKLHFWNGAVMGVTTPKIAVLGIDCTVGKRTTCRFILETCLKHGIQTEMIYTGQTGWLQGYKHGFILDATPNDFVSGEIEKAIIECDRQSQPELILIEGQSSLMNPSGPCGSEFLLSGNIKGVVLQHVPFRNYFDELESIGCQLPAIENEIALIRAYGAETLAVTLNGTGGTSKELTEYRDQLSARLSIPILLPLQDGLEELIPVIQNYMGSNP
ncbi:MAG: DUF1611 domain-containing protein [Desulfobacterales bacterium]|nr:DUF1611 domain-containing protein [Desulfobacterales bacterium]MDX2512694.1 DUF1611 domain-containing protein [Desulfobacterales bacterium]